MDQPTAKFIFGGTHKERGEWIANVLEPSSAETGVRWQILDKPTDSDATRKSAWIGRISQAASFESNVALNAEDFSSKERREVKGYLSAGNYAFEALLFGDAAQDKKLISKLEREGFHPIRAMSDRSEELNKVSATSVAR